MYMGSIGQTDREQKIGKKPKTKNPFQGDIHESNLLTHSRLTSEDSAKRFRER